jgi:cis-3-alkyl-4-acyloxetan-2-one decarboxylase
VFDIITHRVLRIPYTLHVRKDQRHPNPKATVLFLHGIGNTGDAWNDVIKELPDELHLITIDLLGFGRSQRPSWIRYSAKTQARSVMATFLKLRIRGPVIVVGHSLGSLVAVEIAKRYPLIVRSLVLCSPPFYKVDEKQRVIPGNDKILRDMYHFAQKRPENILKLSALAIKYGLVNKSFSLTQDDLGIYMDAMESTIINQTSLVDATKLDMPITVIRGRFDPIIVPSNLRRLAKNNKNVTLRSINAGHEVMSRVFILTVVETIRMLVYPGRKKESAIKKTRLGLKGVRRLAKRKP